MNEWLKMSICSLIVLLGQSQFAFSAEDISKPIQLATGPVDPDDPFHPPAKRTVFAG